MPVGLEIYNSSGIPQSIDLSYNLVLVQKGTVTVGSNTAATGTEAFVTLTTKTEPYIVFIKCSGNAAIIRTTGTGFLYFMAQGTTTFDYWAYNRSSNSGNVGMQVFNADGSLRWNITERTLNVSSVQGGGSMPTNTGPGSTSNLLVNGSSLTIPSGHAVAYSDPGYFLELYTGVPGPTLCPNMRYWPCVNVSGTALKINYGRRFANLGALPGGVAYQTTASQSPSFVLTAPAF